MDILTPQLPQSSDIWNINLTGFMSGPSTNLLWGIVGGLAILLGAITLILYYHWLRYGFGDRMVIFAQALYTLILLVGFIIMIISISYYDATTT